MLSRQALKEFKKIWKEENGEGISDGLAIEEATQLLTLFNIVYFPIKKKWDDDYETNQRNLK